MFTKDVSNRTEKQIRNEVELQNRAAKKNLAPKILQTDFKTFIKMEKIPEICVADKYGESIRGMPKEIVKEIYNILHKLYYECDIEYIDVTPYNFIEYNGKMWVIDFGDAKPVKKNWYLQEVFENGLILSWNPDFK
jgi:tRNA A-37 threonylcarbamoyl transferase component Bud32